MKIYKIRNKEGLFSTGTVLCSPDKPSIMKFDETGQFWTLSSLEKHLSSTQYSVFWRRSISRLYKNCQVVEFELTESENEINLGQLTLEKAMFNEI